MSKTDDLALQPSDGEVSETSWIDFPAGFDSPPPPPERPRNGGDVRILRAPRLVSNAATTPLSIEQYRRLAAVMHQAQVDRGIKTVMVASAFSGEGKSLTASNLALTLSESYRRRVLLVDADLRRPMLHDIFQIPNLEGLSDGLKSKVLRKMPLVEITPNLSLLPGGRPDPDPMGGLTSDRMKHVMKQAVDRFDWVILDTPPIALLPDGSLVANMVDTVLLVVAACRTPCTAVQRTVAAIGKDQIIGTVLNFVDGQGIAPALQAYDYARQPYSMSRKAFEGTA